MTAVRFHRWRWGPLDRTNHRLASLRIAKDRAECSLGGWSIPAGSRGIITSMHWFWRATIGIAFGCLLAGLSVTVFEKPFRLLTDQIVQALGGVRRPGWQMGVGVSLGYFLPALLLAFGVYGLLTLKLAPREQGSTETLCRHCGYILRGITEPRCPECEERI